VIAYSLHYQSLAIQDGSEVVQNEIADKIFFKSLWSELFGSRPEGDLVKP
jgi:hypothetical protein